MRQTNSELWAMAVQGAQAGESHVSVFRSIRTAGGRDLVKSDEEFEQIYLRFKRQPLFAAQWLLNERRLEFQRAVSEAIWELTPTSDAQVDDLVKMLTEFEQGSFSALITALDTIKVERAALSESLRLVAQQLHPGPFNEYEKRKAGDRKCIPSPQLELPLGPQAEQPGGVPEMPPRV